MRRTCFPWTRHSHSLRVQVDGDELQILLAFAAAWLERRAWERSGEARRLQTNKQTKTTEYKQTVSLPAWELSRHLLLLNYMHI